MMDILITFNTAFYNRGLIVLNRKEIAKSYMKFWFWLDLISSFPYSWLSDGLFEDEPDEDGD